MSDNIRITDSAPFGTLGGQIAVSTGDGTCGACDCQENCIERGVSVCKVRGLEILGTYSMDWNNPPLFGSIETDAHGKTVFHKTDPKQP